MESVEDPIRPEGIKPKFGTYILESVVRYLKKKSKMI